MTATPLRYRRALEQVLATGRRTARDHLDVRLPHVTLVLTIGPVPRLAAVPPGTIELAVTDLAQLQPPPTGANTLYGVCHELAHLIAGHVFGAPDRLPVVWDEALAHLLAVEVLLPALHATHGSRLWPDTYPDYLDREGRLPVGPDGRHPPDVATLARTSAQLSSVADVRGHAALLRWLAALPATQRTLTLLGPALRQAAGDQRKPLPAPPSGGR